MIWPHFRGYGRNSSNFSVFIWRIDDFIDSSWLNLTFKPDNEDLDKTIEEELVIDVVGTEAIGTIMKEASKSSTVPQGMIKKNFTRTISI